MEKGKGRAAHGSHVSSRSDSVGTDQVVGGTVFAGTVREGGEAEARRAVVILRCPKSGNKEVLLRSLLGGREL